MLATAATLLVVLVAVTPGPRPIRPRAVDLSPTTTHDVRILHDTWGVPHVFGRTNDDADTIQGALLAARLRR